MKNLCSGTNRGGFQFLLILDLWGISFQAVVVIGLGNDLLFRSVLGQCSWCCAIYYYSLTQTSILWNGNCASGYRALKVSSNLEKFPFLKWASGNRALNFLGNFWKISESFLETVRVGTFLVFSRKFPRKCASGYVPPFSEVSL